MELIVCFGDGSPKPITGCFCGRSTSNANKAGFLELDAA
jgi:hypothetical protein